MEGDCANIFFDTTEILKPIQYGYYRVTFHLTYLFYCYIELQNKIDRIIKVLASQFIQSNSPSLTSNLPSDRTDATILKPSIDMCN